MAMTAAQGAAAEVAVDAQAGVAARDARGVPARAGHADRGEIALASACGGKAARGAAAAGDGLPAARGGPRVAPRRDRAEARRPRRPRELPARCRAPRGRAAREHDGGPLLRHADLAPAAAGADRERAARARAVGRARRAHRRPAAVPLARRDARRLAALLLGRRGRALHRPARAVQDQHAPPAPGRRPGLADRDRPLAAAGDLRREHRGRRRAGRLLHQARLRAPDPLRGRAPHDRRAGDRHSRPHQRRARVLRRAQLRRGGPAALHRHRGRLQLAVRRQGDHLPVPRRRDRRDHGADPGPRTTTSGATRRTARSTRTTCGSSTASRSSCAPTASA